MKKAKRRIDPGGTPPAVKGTPPQTPFVAVRLWGPGGRHRDVTDEARLRPDDSVAQARRKLAAVFGTGVADICLWTARRIPAAAEAEREAAAQFVVDAAMDGRRAAPREDLARAFAAYSGVVAPSAKKNQPKGSVAREEALRIVVEDWGGLTACARTVGARLVDTRRRSAPALMTGADPFRPGALDADVRLDPELVSADGRPRRGGRYAPALAGEAELLEDALDASDASNASDARRGGVLDVITRADLAVVLATSAGLTRAPRDASQALPPGLEHGVLDRFFPLRLLSAVPAAGTGSAPTSPAGADVPRAVAEADRHLEASLMGAEAAIAEAEASGSMRSVVAEATLTSALVRLPAAVGASAGSATAYGLHGADLLYELFAALPTSHEVPCVVLFDGVSSRLKLFKTALAPPPEGDVTAAVARRWAATAAAASSGSGNKPSLRVYCAVRPRKGPGAMPPGEAQQFASYVLRWDLSAQLVVSGLGRLGVDAEAQRAGLAEAAEAVERLAVAPLQAALTAADAMPGVRLPSARVSGPTAHAPLASDTKLSFRVNLAARQGVQRVPTPAQVLAACAGRLSALLTVVATPPGGGLIVLEYRRAAGASLAKRADLLVRLMRGRPRDQVIREMVATFAMPPDDAASLYDATLGVDRDDQPFVPMVAYRMEEVPVIALKPTGRLGFVAEVSNVGRFEYVERLTRLLRLLVAEAGAPGAGAIGRRLPPPPATSSLSSSLSQQQQDAPDGPSPSEAAEDDADELVDEEDLELDAELGRMIEEEFGEDPSSAPQGDLSEGAVAEDPGVQEGLRDLYGDVDGKRGTMDDDDDGDKAGDDDDDAPRNHVLNMLRRADRVLFKYPGTRYATDCARNMMRQPIVLTREELARTDKLYPGGHSGAIINYGSTPELAERNAYICPEVWCPRSRVALSRAQFEALGRRCPPVDASNASASDPEPPILLESGYFDGRARHPGFLDRRKHPAGFCMPCCFKKPAQHVDRCGATVQGAVEAGAKDATGASAKKTTTAFAAAAKPASPAGQAQAQTQAQAFTDAKYVRGPEVWPLETGRYGMLPQRLARALGSRRCGNRDDGSGQLTVNNHCFVRRGVNASAVGDVLAATGTSDAAMSSGTSGASSFLACAAHVLGVAGGPDALVAAVRAHLSASDFLTLDGGRVARRWMDGLDPVDLLDDAEACADLAEWLVHDAAYVARFSLERTAAEAKAWHAYAFASGRKAASASPELMREALVRGAMRRYLDRLGDADVPKTHGDGLLDLLSRPLPWLNASRVNLMLVEMHEDGGGDDANALRATVGCPPDGADPGARWRLADPVAILVRRGKDYEPVVQVSLHRGKVAEDVRFHADSNPRLAAAVRGFLGACGSSRSRGRVAAAVWALALEGRPVVAQVVDCFFRLVGLVAKGDLFVPLAYASRQGRALPVLAGEAGAALRILYVGDVASRLRPNMGQVGDVEALFARLAEAARDHGLRPDGRLRLYGGQGKGGASSPVVAVRLANGGVVPLAPKALVSGPLRLEGGPQPLKQSPGKHGRTPAQTQTSPVAYEYLEHLDALVRVRPDPDARTEWAARWARRDEAASELRSRVVRVVRADAGLSAELAALRSSLHPLGVDGRRREALRIVELAESRGKKSPMSKERVVGPPESKATSSAEGRRAALADALLFGPRPLSLRKDDGGGGGGGGIRMDASDAATTIVLTEGDIAAGALELEIQAQQPQQQRGAEDAATSAEGAEGRASSGGPSASSASFASPADAKENKKNAPPPPAPRAPSPLPLDERDLARYVRTQNTQQTKTSQGRKTSPGLTTSYNKVESSHRSAAYRQRRVVNVPLVDVYLAIHLAHRTLYSDAPASLDDAVRAVQNALLRAAAASPPYGPVDGTLGKGDRGHKNIQHKGDPGKRPRFPWASGRLADAVASRGPGYVASTFEIEELARFLGVEVLVLPERRASKALSLTSRGRRRSENTGSKRGASGATDEPRSAEKGHVVLVQRADGRGHDLALAPSTDVPGAGHRILFP